MSFNRFFLFLAVLGTLIFTVGMHQIDNAWNLSYLEDNFGSKWTDSSPLGNKFTKDSLYNTGIMCVFSGFLLTVASVSFLSARFEKFEKRKKKSITDTSEYGFQ